MNIEQERTADDVYRTMMSLELKISNEKIKILENSNDENAFYAFSEHTFYLLVKRYKHSFYKRNEFERGDKLERLVMINSEPVNHTISAQAIKVMMNVNLYNINLDDTFMETLKEYSEYLKPLLNVVISQ
jgi:hypothetical protein